MVGRTCARALMPLALIGALASACSSTPPPPTGTARASADRIRIGLVSPFRTPYTDNGPVPFPQSNVSSTSFYVIDGELVRPFLFRGLYRLDSVLTPVPDLAAAPCDMSGDSLQVTCKLLPAKFSDGSSVTADDVAFTYDLARAGWAVDDDPTDDENPLRPDCAFSAQLGWCLHDAVDDANDVLKSIEVIDPSTVRFHLRRVEPLFITQALPKLAIDSKRAFEQQFNALQQAAGAIGPAQLRQSGELLGEALGRAEELQQQEAPFETIAATCEPKRAAGEQQASAAGIELPNPLSFNIGPSGAFDSCQWLGTVADALFTAADSLDSSGFEAEARAYHILPLNWHPVGAGPWRVDEQLTEPGKRVVLTANPYADPPPATPRIDFLLYPSRADAGKGLASGEIDWLRIPWDEHADVARVIRATPGIDTVAYAVPASWTELDFNVREGMLFSDTNLRHALAACIDLVPVVDTATQGMGAPAASVFGPNFWPAASGRSVGARDVAGAKRLIESSGWTLAGDRYVKAGKPLSAELWTRSEFDVRARLAELIADEAKDCGMDLTVQTADGDHFFNPDYGITNWPHIPPGRSQPFDMLMVATVNGLDPDPNAALSGFTTSSITSADQPVAANDMGYSNTSFDTLVEQAAGVLDVAERAELYRQALAILDRDLPQLPLFYPVERVALRPGLRSLGGPLQFDRPGWNWQLEKLVLDRIGQ